MSPDVTGLVLLWALLTVPPQTGTPACPPDADAVIEAADAAVRAGEFGAAEERLRHGVTVHGSCAELFVAAWGWSGWQTAVAAAARGGTEESLAGVRGAVAALGGPGPAVSPAAYAASVLSAAAAAAQDEREEMGVWLEHARDLAAKLEIAGERARWPLPIDLVDGELWMAVADYDLAEASYARALAERDSAVAWRGLARARDRRGHRDGACAAYRRALDLAAPIAPEGVVATDARGYLRNCER